MEKIENVKINSIEKEPKLLSKIYFVRHGATQYKEYQICTSPDLQKDLTPEGEQEILSACDSIIKELDIDVPLRILSSTRVRAKQSAEILQNALGEKGVHLDPASFNASTSIEGARTKGAAAEIWTELGEMYGAELDQLWRKNEISHPDKVESNEELFNRIRNSFEKGIRIIRKNEDGGHRNLSQIVLVSHGEIIEGLIAAFGLRPFYDPERKFKTGGVAEIKVFSDMVTIKYDDFEYVLNV